MQLSGGASGAMQSEINITPLVDVVLVLLIIFMVVVPLLMQGYDVSIPKTSAEATATPPAEETQLILTISAAACDIVAPPPGEGLPSDCRVSLNGQEVPAAELSSRVSEILSGRPSDQHVLFLAVDDGLNYEGVLRVVDLAKTGVDDLKIEFIAAD